MMTMLTAMTMMGRARDDGDNDGGSDSQGQRRARTWRGTMVTMMAGAILRDNVAHARTYERGGRLG